MGNIKFKIAAKTNVGRVRTNNEDNFQAACDLTTAPMKWVNDMECDLGSKGALLVVADGMGGMNAGEVASELAVNTIKEFFSPEKISDKVLESKVGIETFLKNAIIEADNVIKKTAKEHPEHKGMGTTVVIAWIIGDTLYVAWCGDSRAYIYNRLTGLRQISKDHSYVQTLVDKGKISAEDAFDYPDSNIITRCLGDGIPKARPDILSHPIKIHNNDIILLCTDGLSGMIRNHEIEMIMANNEDNMLDCCDQLIETACDVAGEDNITVALCKIISGLTDQEKITKKNRLASTIAFSKKNTLFKRKWLFKTFGLIFVVLVSFFTGFLNGGNNQLNKQQELRSLQDSDFLHTSDSGKIKDTIDNSIFQIRIDDLNKNNKKLTEENDTLILKINKLTKEKKALSDSIKKLLNGNNN